MKTKTNKTFVIIALMAMLVAGAQSVAGSTKITPMLENDSITFTGMTISHAGMGKPVVRMRDAGIFLSNTGMCLVGKLSLKVKGHAGKRLIMSFNVLDADGNDQADSNGPTAYLIPVDVPSDNYSCEAEVRIPYAWIDMKKKPKSLNFAVDMFDFVSGKDDPLIATSIINFDPSAVKVDPNTAGKQVLGDIFSGGSIGGGGGAGGGLNLGSIMGAMLGGGSDTAEHTCMKCDGTGICEYCDGDAFLNPSICRKCAQNPGICRSCEGSGTTTVKLDIDKSRW